MATQILFQLGSCIVTGPRIGTHSSALRARRLACSGALTTIFFCSMDLAAGCDGGSASVAPSPVVTPSGTLAITVSVSAMPSSGMPLQLPARQLTLIMKQRPKTDISVRNFSDGIRRGKCRSPCRLTRLFRDRNPVYHARPIIGDQQ
jgi:hypothetical protein